MLNPEPPYRRSPAPPEMNSGWHIFRDGDAWFAVGPAFEDPVISTLGWGATPENAHHALAERHLRKDNVLVPPLSEFQIWG